MLKLLIRVLLLLGAAAIVTPIVLFLSGVEGATSIQWGDTRITLPTINLAIGLAVLFAVLWFAIAVARGTLGSVSTFFGFLGRRKQKHGLDALSKALRLLAEGDGRGAMRAAMKAERLLANPALTRLVNAQAAEMAGDRRRAEIYYEAMSDARDTDFLGVQGLLKQALTDNKSERALRLAERAHALRPKEPWVLDRLLELQLRKGDWTGARETIEAGVRAKRLTRDVADRRRAVLYLKGAQGHEAAGDASEAFSEAVEATRLSPGLAPAAAMAARLQMAEGQPRDAARTLIRAWRQEPHPEIAAAYAALAPGETPAERLKRFERLLAANPDEAESRLVKAELAVAASELETARTALGDLPTQDPSARACALMAAVEQGQAAEETTVRGWLAKAASAPRGAQWVCENCGTATAQWDHVCKNCFAFDTLVWRQTEGPEALADAALFPLLSGGAAGALPADDAASDSTAIAVTNGTGRAVTITPSR